ncbi:probable adenylate kinase 7, mitochondrial [Lycium ferocissimum]|uniref:probable adenylate kinase 7, mitochondrial n=1 Tax=Lycium ferocissimum TaxID=112874 RepID=UPI002814B56E|nr:probable adenylate kinase 7, mitochondrial [Lycium ferocissimum]
MAVLSFLGVSARPILRASSKWVRAYGSAAAAQLDYHYDCYDYEESAGSVPRRGVQWLIMGDPMTQRHVYAQWLSKLLDVPHISMGSLVRQELHPRSTLYDKIADAVNDGKLVPEELIFDLLSKRLEEGYCRGESGFILDGIPRSKFQAEILDKVVDIDLVLNLKCSDSYLSKNDRSNGIYSADLELEGGNLRSSRVMDSAWREKQHVHAEQIKPLEEYYRKQKKLLDFQVAGGPSETWQGLLTALHLQHMMSAAGSTQLTAGC